MGKDKIEENKGIEPYTWSVLQPCGVWGLRLPAWAPFAALNWIKWAIRWALMGPLRPLQRLVWSWNGAPFRNGNVCGYVNIVENASRSITYILPHQTSELVHCWLVHGNFFKKYVSFHYNSLHSKKKWSFCCSISYL